MLWIMRPREAAIHYNAGNVLRELNGNAEAERAYREALEFGLDRPGGVQQPWSDAQRARAMEGGERGLAKINSSRSIICDGVCKPRVCSSAAKPGGSGCHGPGESIRIRPEYADAHWLLSHAYLLGGRFQEGWREYEWRWAKLDRTTYPYLAGPRWDGSPVDGKTILLYTEQGYGDGIQFIRYAPLLADMGAKVIVECQPELIPLFRGVRGIRQLIPRGENVPDFDLQCPLMSLPQHFAGGEVSAGERVPYVQVDRNSSRAWQQYVREKGEALNVGLVWAGNPTHRNDLQRSLPSGGMLRSEISQGYAFSICRR